MKIRYLFRIPQYPILCNLDGTVIGALTEKEFIKQLSRIDLTTLTPEKHYEVIDSRAEGWSIALDFMAMSPLTIHKKWTKKQIIQMVNTCKNKNASQVTAYPEASISSKRFDRIILELVTILND